MAKAADGSNYVAEDELLHGCAALGFDLTDAVIETHVEDEAIKDRVLTRLGFISQKNWAEADRIRDELLAQGIQLKDGKDPATGERVTTWEVKR